MRPARPANENNSIEVLRRFPATALCALVLLAAAFAAGDSSAQPGEEFPDFSGYWMRPEGGNARIFYPPENGPGPVMNTDDTRAFVIGDHMNPILRPHAAAAVKAHGDQGRAGNVLYPAWSLCWPPGIPLILNMAEPVQILQEADQVTILYQRGMQVRKVYLGEEHPDEITPSWNGHSVGHYEGANTLVIDTVGQDTRSLVDRFGTPRSEEMRVVERYTITADRQTLNVEFQVEDPKTFMTAWSARVAYVRPSSRPGYEPGGFNRDDERIAEGVCAENNRDAQGGVFPIPYADTRDF